MIKEKIELKSQKRDLKRSENKSLRRENKIPAVIYSHSLKNNIYISVDKIEFLKIAQIAEKSSIIDLDIDGKIHKVLINDASWNYKGDLIHIDFYEVKKGEKLTTEIPIEAIGEAPASKKGLLLDQHLEAIRVKCTPEDLVKSFEVDISSLSEDGDLIRISDLNIPEKFELLQDKEEVIFIIQTMREEKIEEPETEEGEEGEMGEEESSESDENKNTEKE
ncbi:50S ribosomal protein L25 [Patescibacteria group bacterium]|nr:50S ribosomal protein L25 [Patescibacteria group bacterium]